MDDRTVIVTGGNAGLGYETARNIALSDPAYRVVLACRSRSRGERAAASLRSETGNPHVQAMQVDLASLASVRAFATAFTNEGLPPLRGIVCNAGISAAGVAGAPRTEDGFEMIFGVNHLGHFLLTNLLLPAMDDQGRIVFVTSDLHDPPAFFPARVRYDSGEAIAHGKAGMAQYCTSKLCNIYCTYEMARRIREHTEKRITVNAFNPGAMSDTGFSTPTGNALTRAAVRVVGGIMGTLIGKQSTAAESGAALASLITGTSFATTTGAYIDRGAPTESSPLSRNAANARELWQASTAMTGLLPAETIFSTSGVG
ncbi:SDR family NAD(P)-dependent oxidoreductase [Herbiconiux ginsengi]|uniref:NAD(P)-dependent dehydrogenase, short-chain alcohol dehydrogenase family n=1 Tax=Herbiconiux ginsengi TaxID=381665 RepID=A0A1H3KZX4_9MICO|nr:SDR family NAD(P)-dependent oxidoreductase [Herbiconiux ginsengi]SDY57713.1 NAD(P)-dependent dehydrogenase, short-chain alcohol dehydrogenase family [Herbiconiux ginsengi]